ncbi:MAG: PKD domain-containing protein [Methanobacteriaceae archaeon]
MKKHAIILVMAFFMVIILCGSASAEVIPTNKNVNLTVSNDAGARFDDMGNDSYNFFNATQGPTQGLGSLKITSSNASTTGDVTFTTNSSGTFYMTDSGGRGWIDNGILILAVNGTIPDDFAITITASGYQWAPVAASSYPLPGTLTYVTMTETFTKSDFLYGPQDWRPSTVLDYPIFEGQDMAAVYNSFSIMVIDLYSGIIGPGTLGKTEYTGLTLIDNGMIKISYSLQNFANIAAFDAYGYCVNSNQGRGVRFTNTVNTAGQSATASGYYVNAVAPTANFTATPTSGKEPLTVQFTDISTGTPTFSYQWDFENDGTIDSTEKNPSHTYNGVGTYTVKLTVTNLLGENSATKTNYIITDDSIPPTVTATPAEGTYYAPQNVVLAANEVATIYYTTNGTDPTKSSTLYTGPVLIDTSKILKFIAWDPSDNQSPIYTQQYLIYKSVPYSYTVKVAYKSWYKKWYKKWHKVWYKKWYKYHGKWRYKWRYKWSKWMYTWRYTWNYRDEVRWATQYVLT